MVELVNKTPTDFRAFTVDQILARVTCRFGLYFSEYCSFEKFSAQCLPDEIVLMTSARFGRMRTGNCVTSDLDLGCGADVMYIFDEQCSGKRSCDVLVGDKNMGERSTCNQDLLQYLQADHKCVRGEKRCILVF